MDKGEQEGTEQERGGGNKRREGRAKREMKDAKAG